MNRTSLAQLLYSFYKARWLTGFILSLPVIFGTCWYALSTYFYLERYRRSMHEERAIDLEIFQVVLHDQLQRDLNRLRMPEPVLSRDVPTISLSLTRANLDALNVREDDRGGGGTGYVKGLLQKDGKTHAIRVRYRGEQPWHHINAQRSMKVRLEDDDLLDGIRTFNLVNDPTPYGLEEQIMIEIARESGLLAPEYHPVWVRLNNHDMGVYRFQSQPDELLIRRSGRMPGNMYSGDTDLVDPSRQVGALFFGKEGWQKVAAREGTKREDPAMPELERLLDAVNHGTHQTFAIWAERELDLERYALLDALDVVFCASEHDYFSNHKFYADPYSGKLEPLAWGFRGFQHEATLNVVDHPLLIRLKLTPGYLARRNRLVYRLLTAEASLPALRQRSERIMRGLARSLVADPYWDAYKLLPRVSRFHRFLPRPMTLDKWMDASEYELSVFAQRSRFLLDELEGANLRSVASPLPPENDSGDPGASDGGGEMVRIDFVVSGHGAHRINKVEVRGPCRGQVEFYADQNRNGLFDSDPWVATVEIGRQAALATHDWLSSGVQLVPHPEPAPKRGRVRVLPKDVTYSYFLKTRDCVPTRVAFEVENLVTGGSQRIIPIRSTKAEPIDRSAAVSVDAVPRFSEGEVSPHPWAFMMPPEPSVVKLGPGLVRFEATHTFGAHETVEIAAGTLLELATDASLIFHGPVFMRGTAREPILIRGLDNTSSFGGVVVRGASTRGSKLLGLQIEGGKRVVSGSIPYTAVLNLHDTADILVSNVAVRGSKESEDVVHVHRVANLRMHEVEVESAFEDGIDLEFVSGELRGIWVLGAGDDCLDLMSSTLLLRDSLLARCSGNGISVGEATELSAVGLVVVRSNTGTLVKNASELRMLRSLLFDNETGFKAKRSGLRYGGKSRVGLSEVFVLESRRIYEMDPGNVLDVGEIRSDLPGEEELSHLKEQMLGIRSWRELSSAIDALGGGHIFEVDVSPSR